MSASPESEPAPTTSGETARAAPAGLEAGMRDLVAGRYRLIRKLAEGGMGSVFIAEHTLSQKRMALKVVHPYLCRGRQGVERFRREVSAAAQIDHPGIVQVYDAGVDDDGGFFMAMELLSGESIGDRLRREWPGMATSVGWIEQMLEPLAKAHAKGYVHRDLKPDNVFIAQDEEGRERIKILDFGLAREVEKGGPTRSGITFGTPEYMSPEQAMSARKVRPPGDVWSVGVMLYELLSGEHPFTGETPNAIMANAIKEPLPPLRDKASHVPRELAEVVERALEKEPEHRPQTAGEFLEALRAVTQRLTLDQTVPAAPVAPPRWDDESGEPLISSDFPVHRRQADIATHVAAPAVTIGTSTPPRPTMNRGVLVVLLGGALLLIAMLSAALFFVFSASDTASPTAAATRPVAIPEPPVPASLRAAEPAAAEVVAPPPVGPEAVAPEAVVAPDEPEPPPTEAAAGSSARRTARPAERPSELPADPYAAPLPLPEDPYGPAPSPTARPAATADLPEDPYAATPLNEARACMTRNDRACAIRALEGRARTAADLEMLIDLYRGGGRTPQALDTAQRYLRRYSQRPRAAEFRTFLRENGR